MCSANYKVIIYNSSFSLFVGYMGSEELSFFFFFKSRCLNFFGLNLDFQ